MYYNTKVNQRDRRTKTLITKAAMADSRDKN